MTEFFTSLSNSSLVGEIKQFQGLLNCMMEVLYKIMFYKSVFLVNKGKVRIVLSDTLINDDRHLFFLKTGKPNVT